MYVFHWIFHNTLDILEKHNIVIKGEFIAQSDTITLKVSYSVVIIIS